MIDIDLYAFSKKSNSTKKPGADTERLALAMEIKDSSSMLSPTIDIAFATDAAWNPAKYNYAYIPSFNRYYFVGDWTYDTGLWTVQLAVDVLATYRADILKSTQYVLRSASSYNADIIDTIYPARADNMFAVTEGNISNWEISDTTIIIGVINGNVSSQAGIAYYAMKTNEFAQLRGVLMSGVTQWNQITDFSGDIAKAFIDPFQYIVSAMVFPLDIEFTKPWTSENVKFGFWDSGIAGRRLKSTVGKQTLSLDKPTYPFVYRGYWQVISPFAEYMIYCQPWGIIPLDSTDLGTGGLYLIFLFDYVTGLGTLEIRRKYDNVRIAVVSAQVGVQIQISQITTNYMSLVSSPGSAIGTIVGAGISALDSFLGGNSLSSIASAAQASFSKVSVSGTSAGFAGFELSLNGKCYYIGKYFPPVEENNEHLGRPLCAKKQLSVLSGYCLCADGDVEINGMRSEQEAIKNYLMEGFFIE